MHWYQTAKIVITKYIIGEHCIDWSLIQSFLHIQYMCIIERDPNYCLCWHLKDTAQREKLSLECKILRVFGLIGFPTISHHSDDTHTHTKLTLNKSSLATQWSTDWLNRRGRISSLTPCLSVKLCRQKHKKSPSIFFATYSALDHWKADLGREAGNNLDWSLVNHGIEF